MSRTQSVPAPEPSLTDPSAGRPRRAARLAALGLGLAVALAALVLGGPGAPPSFALGSGPCTMEILVDGRPVPEYLARGSSYIEALAGREYAVRLTNRSDRRIAVALTVDGLNSIDAKTTTASDATKWIIDPWQSITIDGWQTSALTARKFFFTTESRSYGAWLGKTKNLGVISAAVFRETLPRPQPLCGDRLPCPYGGARDNEAPRSKLQAPPAASSPEPERRAEAQSSAKSRDDAGAAGSSKEEKKDADRRALSDELAATGIGRELDHRVVRVPFDAEDHPATVMEVRYEYRDALVKLGVLRCEEYGCGDRMAQRERARGFTDGDYAPDPFRGRR